MRANACARSNFEVGREVDSRLCKTGTDWQCEIMLSLALFGVVASIFDCSRRLDLRFLPLPHACKQANITVCNLYYWRAPSGVARPCGDWRNDGNCAAGPRELCSIPPTKATLRAALQNEEARLAYRRRRKLLKRAVGARLGERCTSQSVGDVKLADCERWCDGASASRGSAFANGTRRPPQQANRQPKLAPCKYCARVSAESNLTARLPCAHLNLLSRHL